MILCFVQRNFAKQYNCISSGTEIRVYSCTCCDQGRRYDFVLTSQLADPLAPFCPDNRKFPAKELNTYRLLPYMSGWTIGFTTQRVAKWRDIWASCLEQIVTFFPIIQLPAAWYHFSKIRILSSMLVSTDTCSIHVVCTIIRWDPLVSCTGLCAVWRVINRWLHCTPHGKLCMADIHKNSHLWPES